ncbi:hypothetical protein QJ856_gp0398 [Tupanvirus deep ocean]|uniref:Uncharacterized protein n=2 Tax=Tupanvirus TaxID=2094720 RepID=A0AC62A9E4_9VIRU|nr:hypothetical protein QJ856_gp0398 [Tupanvirus deep ocean]QKU34344.1 hypothetical protein [Tupanvirus deep ocean]
MSHCCFNRNEDEIIKSFYEEGYTKVVDGTKSNLVGQTLNVRYYKPSEGHTEIGGVFVFTRFEDNTLYARLAPYCGSEPGQEVAMPKNLWYHELSESQAKSYIPPKVKRVREPAPPSQCPVNDGPNYPITDPENSFIARENLLDTQSYLVHDNGGRPFRVLAHKNAVEIYGDEELIWDEEPIYNILIARYTDFMGVWPGYDSADYSEFQDPNTEPIDEDNKESNDEISEDSDETSEDSNETNEEDGNCTKMWHCSRSVYGQINREDNNSILIQLSSTEYVFVGDTIYSFKTINPIINYFSPLGNNDVPYPVAYGQNEAYFMLDQVYVNKDQIVTPFTATGSEQMYREFYGHVEGPKKDYIPMIDVKVIHERCW